MTSYDVSVVICTWNRADYLRTTLRTLMNMRVAAAVRWDIVVVDNNSTDDTRAAVEALAVESPVPVTYVFEARQGKSYAMNTGVASTSAPIIAFTDDDVTVSPEWLQAGCDPLMADERFEYTGGPVRPMWEGPPPPWFEHTGRTLWGTIAILDYGREPFIFEDRRRVPLGVNVIMRRRLLERVGGFATSMGRDAGRTLLGQELPEFLARTRAAGAVGLYVPEMVLDHHVPSRRLRAEYWRRWWYGKGVSRARLEAIHPLTELGLDLRQTPTVAGIPRFLFGMAARDAVAWTQAILRRDAGGRIAAETQLCYVAGQLRERFRLRRAA
jgi:glycosyltransferase involved in cell wall biosynthesis